MNSSSLINLLPPAPRILVRGTNWLGDAVMTTPALLRLREKFPGAHIALLTPEKLRDLWPHHPAVDEIISFSPGESVLAVGKKLRAGKFDAALVLPNSPRSALEVFPAVVAIFFPDARRRRPCRCHQNAEAVCWRDQKSYFRKFKIQNPKSKISAGRAPDF
jgi:ADP-heptose:LPS heptosyltransferase